ncbi:2-octaprenyl-6-methoxyphenyl hydroxylase [Pseudohalioglobus lutimaris]|uniref:2-octaprenyl-6-methoxyphenyl hydroxylase n=1 Tax=Pseudohalioglobus lutimaris TaxID=1737061 RepID=A0A2N5X3S6_9GAMM|nr:2-octaprenyl-6-methoxyphenyl hydroxylase [Pseudohalioglobus lutimaris]PLW69127.1 2-octaprenyl-6-methoxyphenyl hydroxylase [Pseudohalioglobus lutimaris]
MEDYRDIVIAGGGMVGISLALYLAEVLPAETRICLVEGYPFPAPLPGHKPDYHPAFDARSTALSYSSKLIYERLGIWDNLQQWLCPIASIHVSNRGHFGSTLLQAEDHGWPALGYVVENAWLGNSLVQALHRQGRVELISPARVVDARCADDGVRLSLEGDALAGLHTGLLVVADGAASGLRQKLGFAVSEKPYGQHALVANVAFAKPHAGCAFERFTEHGPVALLPLLGVSDARHRSGLVWTVSPSEGEQLMQCSEQDFLVALQERFGYRLGRMQHVGERHSYPLSLVKSTEQVRQGVVVMGNAAHALHPVAGQGYNLALRDVAELATVLATAVERGERPGDIAVLQRYEQRQQGDQQRTIEFSDRLPSLFMGGDPVLGLARDLALAGLDIAPALKRGFVNYAAGVAAMGD